MSEDGAIVVEVRPDEFDELKTCPACGADGPSVSREWFGVFPHRRLVDVLLCSTCEESFVVELRS